MKAPRPLRKLRAWAAASDLTVPGILVGAGVLALIFLRLGHEVAEADTDAIDTRILLALRASPSDPLGPRWVENAVMHISALGSGAVTTLFALIAVAYSIIARRPRFALLVAVCAIGTAVIMGVLKGLYNRPRPSVVTHIDPPGGLSFPSGHSMISMALYMTLAILISRALPERALRRFVIGTGLFLTLIIGVSRMYLGVHYPTDVLAGWTAGGAWALICGAIAYRLGRKHEIETVTPPPPDPE